MVVDPGRGCLVGSLVTLHHRAVGWRNHEQMMSYTGNKANPCSAAKRYEMQNVFVTKLIESMVAYGAGFDDDSCCLLRKKAHEPR